MSLRGFEPRSIGPKPTALSKLCYRPIKESGEREFINVTENESLFFGNEKIIHSLLCEQNLNRAHTNISSFLVLEIFRIYGYALDDNLVRKEALDGNLGNINCPGNKLSSGFYSYFVCILCRKLHHHTSYIIHKRLIAYKYRTVVTHSFPPMIYDECLVRLVKNPATAFLIFFEVTFVCLLTSILFSS